MERIRQLYIRFIVLCVWICFIKCDAFAQRIFLSLGQTQTSTPFRTSTGRQSGDYLLFTPKSVLFLLDESRVTDKFYENFDRNIKIIFRND
jgi:hypothetical protein